MSAGGQSADPIAAYAAAEAVSGGPAAAWLLSRGLPVPLLLRWAASPEGRGGAVLLPVYGPGGALAGTWSMAIGGDGRAGEPCVRAGAGASLDGAAVRLGGPPVAGPDGRPALGVAGSVIQGLRASGTAGLPVWCALPGAGAGAIALPAASRAFLPLALDDDSLDGIIAWNGAEQAAMRLREQGHQALVVAARDLAALLAAAAAGQVG